MSASAIVPLTITYTPASAALTTATVLGQVLNNGGTNWIPTGTSDNAIYLATEGAGPSTVLDGTTYFLSNGPAVPAQVTISVSGSMGASSSAGMSESGAMSGSMTGGVASETSREVMTASTSVSASAAASSSSTGGVGGPVAVAPGASVAGALVAILAVFGL